MEFIIIAIIAVILSVILGILFGYNLKKVKKITENKELDEKIKKYPNNIEICKSFLKKLNNEKVKVEENSDNEASLYIAVTNKILIANISNTYTRIQTIAHECLHSVQNRKILMFNFIFSNIYLVFFIIICILTVCKKLSNEIMYSNIFLILSFIYYVIRVFLENDAMIKAQFLAREYMQESKYIDNSEIDKIYHGFEELNKSCIKSTNCSLFIGIMIKLVIFNVLALIF